MKYTYEVDHGDDAPAVGAKDIINGGSLVAVVFGPELERIQKLEERWQELMESDLSDAEIIEEFSKVMQ